MASQWFCKVLGQEMGPLSFQDLAEMLRAGTLTESDPVRRKESSQWTPARDIIGLLRAAKIEADETVPPDSESPPELAPPPCEPTKPKPASRKVFIPRPGRRGLLWMGGVGVVALVAVLAVWTWRARQSRRFPEPRLGKPRTITETQLASLLPPRPKVPSVPGLKKQKPKLVPGLEHMDPAFSPTLTGDLRTIAFGHMGYWTDKEDWRNGYDLFTATRADVSRPFGELQRIQSTSSRDLEAYPTLSPDGRELVFVRSDKLPRLFCTARDSTSSPFGEVEPWTVSKLEPTKTQRVQRPQFVSDLSVAFFLVSTDGQDRSIWTVERSAPRGKFEAPRQFPISNLWPSYFIMEGGLRAYFGSPKGIFIVARSSKDEPFGEGVPLINADVAGPIEGTIWVAPQEDVIFYCSPGPGEKPGSARRLWMIRF